MKEKINLFLSYIEFFHKMHAKYMQRFNNKISLMYNNINSDIHFDDTPVSEDKKNEDTNNKNINLKLELNNEETYVFNNTTESGLTTPSNYSFNFNENESIKQKNNLKSIFKNGMKRVSNIIHGCNNNNAIDNKFHTTDDVPFEYFNHINKFEYVNEPVKNNTSMSIFLDNELETSRHFDNEDIVLDERLDEIDYNITLNEEVVTEDVPEELVPGHLLTEEVISENSTNTESVNVEGEKKVNEITSPDKIENGKKKKKKKKTK
jgi:hypothetical protein